MKAGAFTYLCIHKKLRAKLQKPQMYYFHSGKKKPTGHFDNLVSFIKV